MGKIFFFLHSNQLLCFTSTYVHTRGVVFWFVGRVTYQPDIAYALHIDILENSLFLFPVLFFLHLMAFYTLITPIVCEKRRWRVKSYITGIQRNGRCNYSALTYTVMLVTIVLIFQLNFCCNRHRLDKFMSVFVNFK